MRISALLVDNNTVALAGLAFGWVASTGATADYHEISDAVVHSLSRS